MFFSNLLDVRVFGPFISPNSAWLGFNDQEGGTLKKVSILGGPTVTICTISNGVTLGASWAEDDTIIFGTSDPSGLWLVSANGGEPEALTALDAEQGQVNHGWPHILPGGRAVLFTILSTGSNERAEIALLNLETGEQQVLIPEGSSPRYASSGHIVYGANDTLRAGGFDLERLEVTNANPVPVLEGVATKVQGAANFDLARDGSLVYVAGVGTGGLSERTVVWVDRQGNEESLDLPAGNYLSPRVSPDGTRLVVYIPDPRNADVWISAVTRGTLAKLTTEPGRDAFPLWAPDGERVVFQSERDGGRGLFWVAADGSGEVERLLTIDGAVTLRPHGWTPDGRTLVFDYAMPDTTRWNIGVLSMDGERTWEPLISTEANEQAPALSPDGQWIAYVSDETGERLVYVERFPQRGGKETISRVPSAHPMWSLDGRELFYVSNLGVCAAGGGAA